MDQPPSAAALAMRIVVSVGPKARESGANVMWSAIRTFACLSVLVVPAWATPFWLAYEGDDLPENQGWTHEYGNENGQYAGGAVRTIEDGQLVIDSRRNVAIVDYVEISQPIQLATDEVFVAEWRLEVVEANSTWQFDQTLGVFADDAWAVLLDFGPNGFVSEFEQLAFEPTAPGMAHDYRLVSTDLRSYDLFIDGDLSRQGHFARVVSTSRIVWGDGVQGASSLARWDYFRLGVIPEPTSGALAGVTIFGLRLRGMRK